MEIDLKNMSKAELEKLSKDVNKALERIQKKEVKKVRQEMEKMAASYGLTAADILAGATLPKTAPKAAANPKFANPDNPSQTWTGKGRQPEWFKSAIAAGTSPDSMAI